MLITVASSDDLAKPPLLTFWNSSLHPSTPWLPSGHSRKKPEPALLLGLDKAVFLISSGPFWLHTSKHICNPSEKILHFQEFSFLSLFLTHWLLEELLHIPTTEPQTFLGPQPVSGSGSACMERGPHYWASWAGLLSLLDRGADRLGMRPLTSDNYCNLPSSANLILTQGVIKNLGLHTLWECPFLFLS